MTHHCELRGCFGRLHLDIGCGSGGLILRFAARTSVTVHGIDAHADGIAAARQQALERQMTDRVQFDVCDASERLPFDDSAFDAIMSVDAISHMPHSIGYKRFSLQHRAWRVNIASAATCTLPRGRRRESS